MRRLILLQFTAAAALALLPAGARPQDEKPRKEGQDALKTKTEKHKKDVVRLRGLDFKKDVTVGVYTRKELVDFLKSELAKDMPPEKAGRWQRAYAKFGLIPRDMDLIEAFMSLYGGAIAGFYHPETKELRLIRPGEAEKSEQDALKALGIDMEAVTLVHELTHAAQDQHYELSTLPLEDETNDDLILALKGVIEGDASAVGWKFGFRRLFQMMIPRYNALLKQGELPGEAGKLPAYLRQTLTFPYGHGCDFILDYVKAVEGDLKDAHGLFEDLPLSTEQILHPEKYHPKESRDHPMLVTLPDVEKLFGGPWKESVNNVHGEFATRILLRELLKDTDRADRAKAAAEGWDGDRYVVLENGPERVAYVWVTTWDSGRDAREFYSLYASALEAKYGKDAPDGKRGDRTAFDSEGGRVVIEIRGSDVLVLDGATEAMAGRTAAVWKGVKRTEMTQVERVPKFVCEKCDVRKAFSGKCPKCGSELRYRDGETPPKKKRREYSVSSP